MMAERQVVIVKEAQDLIRTIDKLESYAENLWQLRFWYFAINTKRLINVKSN
jgi:hypothetical protein